MMLVRSMPLAARSWAAQIRVECAATWSFGHTGAVGSHSALRWTRLIEAAASGSRCPAHLSAVLAVANPRSVSEANRERWQRCHAAELQPALDLPRFGGRVVESIYSGVRMVLLCFTLGFSAPVFCITGTRSPVCRASGRSFSV